MKRKSKNNEIYSKDSTSFYEFVEDINQYYTKGENYHF